jgi:hypothetical protein
MKPPSSNNTWLGLDVGGANLKAAHSSGEARSVPFEFWKNPLDLSRRVCELAGDFPPFNRAAVTMTAELCDCYPTKAEGVVEILRAVDLALGSRPMVVWGIDGRFHSQVEIAAHPELASAANWLALATFAARLAAGDLGVLIDVGSTTTDIIRLEGGRAAPCGLTDTERLVTGELVYAGVRRTPVCALATELPWRRTMIGLCAELFATTLDVYLALGEIAPDPSDLRTADGRPATFDAARERLARMVGADGRAFSANDAHELAVAADEALTARLAAAGARTCGAGAGLPAIAIVSGSGEFLAQRIARRISSAGAPILRLRDAWGPGPSDAACAYALVQLAAEREN